MGYYDDEGNYHSFRRAPILERRGYYDDEGNYHSSFRKSGNTPMRLGDKDHGSHYGPEQVIPIPCHFIRIGDLLILNDRPCQVIRISVNPQTGQHRYLGVDLFTRQLHEDKSFMSKPSANVVVQTILGPVFRTYRVLDVDLPNGTVTVMTETGDIKAGLPVVKQGSLIAKLEGTLNKGIGNVRALAISEKGTGRELVCDYKILRGRRTVWSA
ncbi:translation protein SH3-like domain-containing protein [Aspergillus oleicola]